MKLIFAIDTNVAVVANGRNTNASIDCRLLAINFIETVLTKGTVVIDLAGDVLAEYYRHLNGNGQPGVGDRFLLHVLRAPANQVQRIELRRRNIDYEDFPQVAELEAFDRSDRKFAALSRKMGCPVANAVDSDWLDHRAALEANGITIEFVCGTCRLLWLEQA